MLAQLLLRRLRRLKLYVVAITSPDVTPDNILPALETSLEAGSFFLSVFEQPLALFLPVSPGGYESTVLATYQQRMPGRIQSA